MPYEDSGSEGSTPPGRGRKKPPPLFGDRSGGAQPANTFQNTEGVQGETGDVELEPDGIVLEVDKTKAKEMMARAQELFDAWSESVGLEEAAVEKEFRELFGHTIQEWVGPKLTAEIEQKKVGKRKAAHEQNEELARLANIYRAGTDEQREKAARRLEEIVGAPAEEFLAYSGKPALSEAERKAYRDEVYEYWIKSRGEEKLALSWKLEDLTGDVYRTEEQVWFDKTEQGRARRRLIEREGPSKKKRVMPRRKMGSVEEEAERTTEISYWLKERDARSRDGQSCDKVFDRLEELTQGEWRTWGSHSEYVLEGEDEERGEERRKNTPARKPVVHDERESPAESMRSTTSKETPVRSVSRHAMHAEGRVTEAPGVSEALAGVGKALASKLPRRRGREAVGKVRGRLRYPLMIAVLVLPAGLVLGGLAGDGDAAAGFVIGGWVVCFAWVVREWMLRKV